MKTVATLVEKISSAATFPSPLMTTASMPSPLRTTALLDLVIGGVTPPDLTGVFRFADGGPVYLADGGYAYVNA